MRWGIIILIFVVFSGQLHAQTKPHAISIGSSVLNDFDDFGWYRNKNALLLSTLKYTYTLKGNKDHFSFGISDIFYGETGVERIRRGKPSFEVFQKKLNVFQVNYKRTLFRKQILDLNAFTGLNYRRGTGLFHGFAVPMFEPPRKRLDLDGLGIPIGAELLVNLPFNFFAAASGEFVYYFYDINADDFSYNLVAPRNAVCFNLHIGYQFGGKKRQPKTEMQP